MLMLLLPAAMGATVQVPGTNGLTLQAAFDQLKDTAGHHILEIEEDLTVDSLAINAGQWQSLILRSVGPDPVTLTASASSAGRLITVQNGNSRPVTLQNLNLNGGASPRPLIELNSGTTELNLTDVGIANCGYTDSSALHHNGGAIRAIAQGQITLTRVQASLCTARAGGFIQTNITTTLTVVDSHFTQGVAQLGGAIEALGPVTLTGGEFAQNRSDNGSGGAVLSWGPLTVNGTRFLANTASGGSGGAIEGHGHSQLEDVWFKANAANFVEGDVEVTAQGGALNWVDGSLELIGTSLFCENSTTGQGGAIATTAPLTASRVVFFANEADLGADIATQGDDDHALEHLTSVGAKANAALNVNGGVSIHHTAEDLDLSHSLIVNWSPPTQASSALKGIWQNVSGTDNAFHIERQGVHNGPAHPGTEYQLTQHGLSPAAGACEIVAFRPACPNALPTDGPQLGAVPYDCTDQDGDGSPVGEDCDDHDAEVHPGAQEVCDGKDNNCDGLLLLGEQDDDEDGFLLCEPEQGYPHQGVDCDDADPHTYPGADERCDGKDNNCDGVIPGDEQDLDLDGHVACSPWVGAPGMMGGDCDDDDDAIHPGRTEQCDGRDNDCSGEPSSGELDLDSDGYMQCAPVPGSLLPGRDCDDEDSDVHPDADELCDGKDNDCDGQLRPDELDQDQDGYVICTDWVGPAGIEGGDCDDANPFRNPGHPEICDGIDNDCDTLIDEEIPGAVYAWRDQDGDGAGAGPGRQFCDGAPPGWVPRGDDCDDTDDRAHPDAMEICDGVDNDCDGEVDGPESHDARPWWPDADNDGYGAAGSEPVYACAQPALHRNNDDDCDDTRASAYPGAAEQCNDLDDDCDGEIDEDEIESEWFVDADGDGYGTEDQPSVTQCAQPDGYALRAGDCEDDNPDINPGVVETCAIPGDQNCDGTEDDAVDIQTWYRDLDGDGFGDLAAPTVQCEPPLDAADRAGDCDDGNPDVSPIAIEVCDGLDNDCNGTIDDAYEDAVDTWLDGDGDGYGAPAPPVRLCEDLVPADRVTNNLDCNDAEPLAWTGAPEVCDGVDNDCNGLTDDQDPNLDLSTRQLWHLDLDQDGWGRLEPPAVEACVQPPDHGPPGDCDDEDSDRNPDMIEVCGDGIDQNCDGSDMLGARWWVDEDGDGWGAEERLAPCGEGPPAGAAFQPGDCDDTQAGVNPGAHEVCGNTVDEDCDGVACERPDSGCGCQAPASSGSAVGALLLALALGRRRRAA